MELRPAVNERGPVSKKIKNHASGPGLGPWGGGVGYLGVFHLFQNVFENVKSGFSKFQMSRNQVFKMPNPGVWKCQNVRNPGFWKCTKSGIFEKSRFSKFRDFLRDARCHGNLNLKLT